MNDKQPKSARQCPALSRTITPKECGMDRVSKISCPETCAHHPFSAANAEGLTGIEERLLKKVQKRVMDELGGDAARNFARQLREAQDEVEEFLLVTQAVHAAGEKEGPDFVERWKKDGFDGLNNDERTLIKAQSTQRPALLRIENVIDAQSMEVTDLLETEGKAFTVVADVELDPAMNGDVLLAWIYDAPLFIRFGGPAFELPEHDAENPVDALAEIAKELGGPMLPNQLRPWLKTHMLDLYNAVADGEGDEEAFGVEDVLNSFDWSELPDFSQDPMPKQRVIREEEIEDRLAPFMHRHKEPEQAVQWFEETWQDIASGVDQLTEGVLSDEGFGVVLIILAKVAAVLHTTPPVRETSDSMRFVWQLGNELRESSRMAEEDAFEAYIKDSPQPVVCEWACSDAAEFAEGEAAVFEHENLAVVFPVLKAAIWEMCHWKPA